MPKLLLYNLAKSISSNVLLATLLNCHCWLLLFSLGSIYVDYQTRFFFFFSFAKRFSNTLASSQSMLYSCMAFLQGFHVFPGIWLLTHFKSMVQYHEAILSWNYLFVYILIFLVQQIANQNCIISIFRT